MSPNAFTLFYPVKPLYINQPFGVHPEVYGQFGLNGHNGLDMKAIHGQSVFAAHDGICYPEIDNNGGNGVILQTEIPFDYKGISAYFKTIYWHLIKANAVVKTGQHVKAGALLGYADSTGFSTGDHLHFGLKPQLWNENNWTWYNVEQHNGYLGAINPTPYFNHMYAIDLPRKHFFSVIIRYGDNSLEVYELQILLKSLGFFPLLHPITAYYGIITAQSVLQFQLHYKVDSIVELNQLQGKRVGLQTLAKLNSL